jgi:2',3'-cyclic-nucleotide 2'-phosphodiesterase (5'-nucleotidase family)
MISLGGLTPVLASDKLTLIYSGNLDGELEPCGCSAEGNLGGIKRRATMLSQMRQQNPDMVVVSAGGLLSSDDPGDRLKAEYILKGYSSLQYDAVGVQWRDLVYGADFIFKEPLPWVVSNWHSKVVPDHRIIQRAGQRIAFFNWLDPKNSPMRQMQGKHSVVDDSPSLLQAALQKAKKNGELTVLVTTLKAKQAVKMIGLKNVDILIERAAYEEYGLPHMEGQTLVVQPGSRGMRLGRLDLDLKGGGIKKWNHKVIPMPESVADAPELASWYEEYNAKVKADYLKRVEIRKTKKSGKSPYVGEEVCSTCHVKQHKLWTGSQHAIAYEDLEDVNKAFDPACIGCHTVGFDKPGGFFDINITGHLLGVQCESCHGAGRAHVEAAGRKPLPNAQWPLEKVCGQCHIQKHSPGFNLKTYWPKVVH